MSEAPSNGDGRAHLVLLVGGRVWSGRPEDDAALNAVAILGSRLAAVDQLERYRPQLERSFPLDEGAAPDALATNAHVVKLVLVP